MAHAALAAALAFVVGTHHCASQGDFSLAHQELYNEGDSCMLLQTGAKVFFMQAQHRATSTQQVVRPTQDRMEEQALFDAMIVRQDGPIFHPELEQGLYLAQYSDRWNPLGDIGRAIGGALGGAVKESAVTLATDTVVNLINDAVVPLEKSINTTVEKAFTLKNSLASKVNSSIQRRLEATATPLRETSTAMKATLGAISALKSLMNGITGILTDAGIKGVDNWAPKVNTSLTLSILHAQHVVDSMGNVGSFLEGLVNTSRPLIESRLIAVNHTLEAGLNAIAGFSTNFKQVFTGLQTGLMSSLTNLGVLPLVLMPINASLGAIVNSTSRMASTLSNGITQALTDIRLVTSVPKDWQPATTIPTGSL